MSYCFNTPCYTCKKSKEDTCKDYKTIAEAITNIHQMTYEEGHQGSGSVVLHCQNKVEDKTP